MIEAVLFDIDGTLLDHERASLASLRVALERERRDLDEDSFAAATGEWRRLEELHYAEYLRGAIALEEQRRRRAAGILNWLGAGIGSDAALDEWFAAFLGGYREHWSLFDDVEPVLAVLEARGLRLGVITNADAALQRGKLAGVGISDRLPVFVASSAVGAAKPDRVIFAAGERLLGMPSERVAYVGDRLDTDARGARDAGMLGIWLCRDRTRPAADDVATIRSLNELPDLLV